MDLNNSPGRSLTRDQVQTLVHRLRNRDSLAMTELYEQYGARVFGFLYRFTNDSALAEDLTQETFLRVWTRIHTFRDEHATLGPWIFSIAKNCALDAHRSRSWRMAKRETLVDNYESLSSRQDLQNELMKDDLARRFRGALSRLTPKQRAVIKLAYYDGLSQSQMARQLKQPLGTVKTWARRALSVLRQELALGQ